MMSFFTSVVIASAITNTTPTQIIASDQYVIPTTIQATVNDAQQLSPTVTWRVEKRHRTESARPFFVGAQEEQPQISAKSAIVLDAETRDVLWQKNPDVRMPPASITKLMTALVWSDLFDGDENATYTIRKKDLVTQEGSKDLFLPVRSVMRVDDLLAAMLVGSYNDVTQALVHSTGLSDAEFVAAMNHKARAIGLQHTTFADPTGLSPATVASAHDVALLAAVASTDPQIGALLNVPRTTITVAGTEVVIETTDLLLADTDVSILGGKTGYIDEAGYCFVAIAQDQVTQRPLIIAVLGAPDPESRFTDTKTLLRWAGENYLWQ